MQIVYRSRDIAEAHIVAGMLKAEGVEAFVGGHYLQGGIGELGMADFAVVRVNDEDVESAIQRLKEYDATLDQGSAEYGSQSGPISFQTATYIMLGFLLLVIFLVSLVG
ncbi:MAG: hypothetical protein CMK89_18905 [Pseudomonadales bacterium]|nr:hypothetical protein [Pseudomonadales bacterium]